MTKEEILKIIVPEGSIPLQTEIDKAEDILELISQEKEKMIEEFRKKLTNTEMTIVFSSTTGNDTKQKVPMYQPQQIEELINLLSDN